MIPRLFSRVYAAAITLASIILSLSTLQARGSASGDSVMPAPPRIDALHPLLVTTPPVIDGNLDEPTWKSAPHVSHFITYAPDFDIVPKEQTDVALAYDRQNLYFAFRCYDDPRKIKASVSARDKITNDDFICVNLDAFDDQQGLTAFYVNPLGIQGDSRFTTGIEDFSPDYVWYSAGKIDSQGYTVEVQLPLKSLRYADADPTTMEVILERFISRRSEHSTFPRLDPAKGFALLTEMYPLEYPGIDHYKLVEILPTITATRQDVRQGTDLVRDKQEGEASLTAKYGITSDLILDGTLNPDFSQVESDAGQVDINLRYSLFYPEKRPFFLEGQDNFNIGANANLLDPTIYYSRTIADPFLGTKLTGKAGSGNTIAAIYAMDNVLEPDRATLGRYIHVPILRYKRTLSNDSYAGFLYAGRELEHTYNRVGGFDEQFRVSDAGVLESNGFLSWAKDDPAGSAVDGNTLGARFSSGNRNLDYNLNFREVSENFRADMGYLARTGVVNFIGLVRPKFYPDSKFFQRFDFEIGPSATKDRPSGLWETSDDLAFDFYFSGPMTFRTRFNYSTEVFDGQRFQTSGVHTQLRAQVTKEVNVSLLYRRIRAIYYPTPEQGKSNVVNAVLTLQPSDNLQAEASYIYTDFYPDAVDTKLFSYGITRLKLTYQVNQYLFFRAIGQYNDYRSELTNDLLASFTYIPGTAVYLGYGSIFDKVNWDGTDYVASDKLLEMRQGLFLKMSYLWRS
jgi:uncharacterized protein DUF5916